MGNISQIHNFGRLLFCFIILSFLSLFIFTPKAHAIDLTKYFFPTGGPGNNISTGEFFKVIDEGNGYFRIQKSQDPRYYERFRVQNGMIYHVEEATWATEEGNIKCSDTGNEASARYVGGQTEWAPTNVSPGTTFTTGGGRVVGWDKTLQRECPTPYNGEFGRRTVEVKQGCVTFPNGVTSDDSVVLTIKEGPGTGETFVYDANRGWIGFSRKDGVDGAYITDSLSSSTHPAGECIQFSASTTTRKTCPSGYTCPKTPNQTLKGERIPVTKTLGVGSIVANALRGLTGPLAGQLNMPDLSQENKFYSSKEFFDRALTDTQQKELKFDVKDLKGEISHPGCGRVSAGGSDQGLTEVESKPTEFNLSRDYSSLLLVNEFWRCTFVNSFDCKLKFTNIQPDYADPAANVGDCYTGSGQTIDKVQIQNSPPQETNVIGQVLGILDGLIRGLGCKISEAVPGLRICDPAVKVEYALQQEKGIPAEATFDDQTVNRNGWLMGMLKTNDFSYDKADRDRDQDEKSEYVVVNDTKSVGSGEQVGVNFKGVADFQKESINLVKSMYVEDIAKNINSLETVPQSSQTPSQDLIINKDIADLLKIPYRDPSVRISDEVKRRIIAYAKSLYPQTLLEQHWNTVVSRSFNAGINPAFALSVWLEESGAGQKPAHFGCDPKKGYGFEDSLDCFIKTTQKSPPSPDFKAWAANYCGISVPGMPICTTNQAGDNNENFLTNVNFWYKQFGAPLIKGVE